MAMPSLRFDEKLVVIINCLPFSKKGQLRLRLLDLIYITTLVCLRNQLIVGAKVFLMLILISVSAMYPSSSQANQSWSTSGLQPAQILLLSILSCFIYAISLIPIHKLTQ